MHQVKRLLPALFLAAGALCGCAGPEDRMTTNTTPAARPQRLERAIFASGCFWGTAYVFKHHPGVFAATAGYIGGHTESPTYREVCTDQTGHAEAVEVLYDPTKVTYEELARYFFETHDPTTVNRQGPDVGTQYRSAIFYLNDEQKRVAEKLVAELKAKGCDAVTEVVPAGPFWRAEAYHQDYYDKNGQKPYCHVYRKRF
jgi:peptide methionine sulfoxide reductase msrA/msrB